jgi:hypothetical protein
MTSHFKERLMPKPVNSPKSGPPPYDGYADWQVEAALLMRALRKLVEACTKRIEEDKHG